MKKSYLPSNEDKRKFLIRNTIKDSRDGYNEKFILKRSWFKPKKLYSNSQCSGFIAHKHFKQPHHDVSCITAAISSLCTSKSPREQYEPNFLHSLHKNVCAIHIFYLVSLGAMLCTHDNNGSLVPFIKHISAWCGGVGI